MTTWTNTVTGLVHRYGNSNADNPKGGVEYQGLQRLVVDLTDATLLEQNNTDPLTSASTVAFFDEMTPKLPANSYVTRAYFVVDTAFTGATANLDIGLMEADGTIIDVDFFDDAVDILVIDAVNDVVVCDGAGVGGVVGTGTTDAYVCFSYDTAAFTAGAGHLVVEYFAI